MTNDYYQANGQAASSNPDPQAQPAQPVQSPQQSQPQAQPLAQNPQDAQPQVSTEIQQPAEPIADESQAPAEAVSQPFQNAVEPEEKKEETQPADQANPVEESLTSAPPSDLPVAQNESAVTSHVQQEEITQPTAVEPKSELPSEPEAEKENAVESNDEIASESQTEEPADESPSVEQSVSPEPADEPVETDSAQEGPDQEEAVEKSEEIADGQDEEKAKSLIKSSTDEFLSKLGVDKFSETQKVSFLNTIDRRVSVAVTKVIIEKANQEQAERVKEALEKEESIEEIVDQIVKENPQIAKDIEFSLTSLYEKMLKEAEILQSAS